MQVLYERCAGIDVHKDQVTVAVRLPGSGPGGRDTQVRKFGGVLWGAAGDGPLAGVAGRDPCGDGGHRGSTRCRCITRCWNPAASSRCWCATPRMSRTCRAARPTRWMRPGWRSCWSAGCCGAASSRPQDIKAVRDVVRYRRKIVQERAVGDPAAGRGAPGRRDQAGLGGVLHRHGVGAGDDPGADRRGTARGGARRAGTGPDAVQDRRPVPGAGGPL